MTDRNIAVHHRFIFLRYIIFLHRSLHADLQFFLSQARFVYNNRRWKYQDNIKTTQGAERVAVSAREELRNTPINRIEVAEKRSRKEDSYPIEKNYLKSPRFTRAAPHVEGRYSTLC